jgi:hypothetical protein
MRVPALSRAATTDRFSGRYIRQWPLKPVRRFKDHVTANSVQAAAVLVLLLVSTPINGTPSFQWRCHIGSTHRRSQNGSNILETNNRSPPCHDNENGARSYVAPGIDLAPDHREGQQQQPQANIEG